jgi:hypothetical protein
MLSLTGIDGHDDYMSLLISYIPFNAYEYSLGELLMGIYLMISVSSMMLLMKFPLMIGDENFLSELSISSSLIIYCQH